MANIVKARGLMRARKYIRQTGSGIKRVSLNVNRRTKIRVRRA